MARPLNTADAVGTVRVVIHLVEKRGRYARGNRSRVITVHNVRVSQVAEIIVEAVVQKAKGGKL